MGERFAARLAEINPEFRRIDLSTEKNQIDLGPVGQLIPDKAPWSTVEIELFKSAAKVLEDMGTHVFSYIEGMSEEEERSWLEEFRSLAEERGQGAEFATQDYSDFILRGSLGALCETNETQLAQLPAGQWDEQLQRYQRLKETLLVNRPGVVSDAARIETVVETRLSGAVNNASDFMWATARIIPVLFEHKFGRQITLAEFEKVLSRSAGPFISIALQHENILSQMRARLTIPRPDLRNRFSAFNPDFFQLSGDLDTGTLGLDFAAAAIENLNTPEYRQIKMGCPALFAKVETATSPERPVRQESKNFILKHWQWVRQLAIKDYRSEIKK